MAEMQKSKNDKKQSGVRHWILQRATALALMPLIIYGTSGFVLNVGGDFDAAREWIAGPVNAGAMLLLFGVGLLHAVLGLEAIFEDYIADESKRKAVLLCVKILAIVLACIAVFSILRIALGL